MILVDIAVTIFYLKKGFLTAKIKANLNILKNSSIISKNQKSIQKSRIIDDDELIREFTNKIDIPKWVVQKENNNSLNKIFEKLSKFSRLSFN